MLMQSTHSGRKMPKDLKVLKRNFLLEEEHFNFKLQFTDIKDCHFAPFLLRLKVKVGKIFERATANDQKNEMQYFMLHGFSIFTDTCFKLLILCF